MSQESSNHFSHFKLQGEWAELLFMARAAEQGLAIARPWGDSSPYDVAIVSQNKPAERPDFLRIQIKSTRCLHSNGAYKCHIDSNGVPYPDGAIDFIAAYIIPVQVWYIIPLAATRRTIGVPGTSGFRVLRSQSEVLLAPNRPHSKYAQYKEAWHLLRQAG